jgi:hypothetical protein
MFLGAIPTRWSSMEEDTVICETTMSGLCVHGRSSARANVADEPAIRVQSSLPQLQSIDCLHEGVSPTRGQSSFSAPVFLRSFSVSEGERSAYCTVPVDHARQLHRVLPIEHDQENNFDLMRCVSAGMSATGSVAVSSLS